MEHIKKIKYSLTMIFVCIIICYIFNNPAFCEPDSNDNQTPVVKLIDSNLETSYVTFLGFDYELIKKDKFLYWLTNPFSDDKNVDLLFEAQLAHPFHCFNHSFTSLSWHGRMYFIPKFVLRMYAENSSPVKTPSFMPRAIYFFWFGKNGPDSAVSNEKNFFYFSLMISHHSNGQSGDFYNPDGSLNTESGSFSTNYVELTGYQIWAMPLFPHSTSLSLRWHPGFNRNDELDDQYEELAGEFKMRIDRNWFLRQIHLNNNKLYLGVSYIFIGRKYIVAPEEDFPAIRSRKTKWYDNYNFSAQLIQNISCLNEVKFFIKYDYGYDYYNIYFRQKISRINIGFSAEPTNFSHLKSW